MGNMPWTIILDRCVLPELGNVDHIILLKRCRMIFDLINIFKFNWVKNALLFISILFFIVACNTSKNKKLTSFYKSENRVKFDFTATRLDSTIQIDARIINTGYETIYYVTSSCNGELYSLVIPNDEAQLLKTTDVTCCMLLKKSIIPKGEINFKAYLHNDIELETILMGIDFFEVNSTFKLDSALAVGLNIYDRPTEKERIIWCEPKSIN